MIDVTGPHTAYVAAAYLTSLVFLGALIAVRIAKFKKAQSRRENP